MPTAQRARTDDSLERGRSFIHRYRFSPNLFATEVLRADLQPWQIESNDDVADYVRHVYGRDNVGGRNLEAKNYFTVRAMHGPGKTFWITQLACWFGSVFPMARIPVIAPKFQQITTRLMLEMRKIRNEAVPDFRAMTASIANSSMRWFDMEEWVLFGQTASKAENLAGLHADYQMVLVDEASGVPEFLFPTIEGALSTGVVQILVLIGNPTKNSGTFAHSHLRPSVAKHYHQISIPLEKAPRVSRKWVQRMIDKYGVDSPIVQIRCFGNFAATSERQLISPEWLALARERGETRVGGDGSVRRLRVVVDVADGGEDKSVVTVLEMYESFRRLLSQRTYSWSHGTASTVGADILEATFKEFGGNKLEDDIVVDALGVGSGLYGVMTARGYRTVRYIGGSAADNPTRYRNRRVQSYMVLRDELRDGLLDIAPNAVSSSDEMKDDEEYLDPWDEFDAQLCSILKTESERVEDLMTKEQMKLQGLTSPDRADSLAMGYAGVAPTIAHLVAAENDEGNAVVATTTLIPSAMFEDYVG